MNKSLVSKILDLAYSKAIDGIAGVESAYDLGNSYKEKGKSVDESINALIKWQTAKAASSGFITGFGGLLAMPLTVPASIASVMYIQIRMVAAIAHMRGHDLKSDKVRTMIYLCMAGNGAKELLKEASIQAGEKAIQKSIEAISLKLATKAGEKTFTSFSKVIPVAGGIIGCSIDAVSTQIIGKVAKSVFHCGNNDTNNNSVNQAA